MLNPLPTSSSMYFHRNCIITMKRHMQKVIKNRGKNLDKMNRCNFFILNMRRDVLFLTPAKVMFFFEFSVNC